MELEDLIGITSPQTNGIRVSTEDKESIGKAIDIILEVAERKLKDTNTLKYVGILLFTIKSLLLA